MGRNIQSGDFKEYSYKSDVQFFRRAQEMLDLLRAAVHVCQLVESWASHPGEWDGDPNKKYFVQEARLVLDAVRELGRP